MNARKVPPPKKTKRARKPAPPAGDDRLCLIRRTCRSCEALGRRHAPPVAPHPEDTVYLVVVSEGEGVEPRIFATCTDLAAARVALRKAWDKSKPPAPKLAQPLGAEIIVRDDGSAELGYMPSAEARDADNRMRDAIKAIRSSSDASELAHHLASLFDATAQLLSEHGRRGAGWISPDAVRETEALVRRVRAAVFDEANTQKRARTYLEQRIIVQSAACDGATSAEALEAAAQRIVSLTHDDAITAHLADGLVAHEKELVACIRACIALRPTSGGQFARPGTRQLPQRKAYDNAFAALCKAIGLGVRGGGTRKSELSRMRKR